MNEQIKDRYFIPIAHCQFVKGACRTVMCDLQRQQLYVVPDDMRDILENYQGCDIATIYNSFGIENSAVLDEYFDFLLDKEAVFLTPHATDRERFTPLSLEYDDYGIIQNAVIDLYESPEWINRVLKELEALGCQYIEFRFYASVTFEILRFIAGLANETEFHSLDFLLPYNREFTSINFEHLFVEFQRVGNISFYNALEDKKIEFLCGLSTVSFTRKQIQDHTACGLIHSQYFRPNMLHFSESQHHNTCLNRKISIDVDGNIKNCPSMPESFGNIKDTTLAEAIEKPGFKKYWNITKDQINVCRDCEFRHICTDCRAYIETPDDIYSKPLKCGYNPYTCEWEEWSTNPLKQQAIHYYNLKTPLK